ncbi:MAG: hypothetical protein HY903_00185 [Deltaproteobacteria bacterium]|nr:hypothetical protein [Deltaproteobacteria bacterium]
MLSASLVVAPLHAQEPSPAAEAPTPPATPVAATDTAPPADVAADQAPIAAPMPVAALPVPAAPTTPADGAAAPPARLSVGSGGVFQPGLLLQGWLLAERTAATTSTFRLRRAEIHAKGEIISGLISYALMIDVAKVLEPKDTTVTVENQDPAPADGTKPETVTAKLPVGSMSVLQDFVITLTTAFADVSLGQFKIPVSWEGYNASAKLLFPERAPAATEFGDKRDLGLRVAKRFKYLGYTAAVFNGAGLNALDNNNDKDLALRVEAYPIDGLVLAGVAYASVGERRTYVKDRYEADVRYESGSFLAQGEYIRGREVGKAGPPVHGQGAYLALGWTFFDALQTCLRVGYLDPDIRKDLAPKKSADRDELFHGEVGLSYFVRKHEAKVALTYGRYEYDDRAVLEAKNQLLLATQISY